MTDKSNWTKGAELAQKLFGDSAGGIKLPEKFRRYTIEHVFGDVWQGDDLALQERSLVTCTTLIALGREDEQKLHFIGAKNLGIPREKIEGVITHVAHYAGWPVAVGALRSLEEVWPSES
jgi:4-carboxymuconolactone decarboxylase